MESDPVFTVFVERRQHLLERLDSTRSEVDAWIEAHKSEEPSLAELANLEGLLSRRREFLAQIIEIDDNFVDHLLTRYSLRG